MFITRTHSSHITIPVFILALFKSGGLWASLPPTSLTVCHEYSCKMETEVVLSERNWREITAALSIPSASAMVERKKIAIVIAAIESYVGPLTGTADDQPGNRADTPDGQMDCIDESKNTTRYLTFLHTRGLLQWHRVSERAYRAPWIFDQHWTATMTDKNTGQQYAIDSWHLANGKRPYIQTIEAWLKKAPLPAFESIDQIINDNKAARLSHQISSAI